MYLVTTGIFQLLKYVHFVPVQWGGGEVKKYGFCGNFWKQRLRKQETETAWLSSSG
jgi:hypothetical protein